MALFSTPLHVACQVSINTRSNDWMNGTGTLDPFLYLYIFYFKS